MNNRIRVNNFFIWWDMDECNAFKILFERKEDDFKK
jgi:hypothetical protein